MMFSQLYRKNLYKISYNLYFIIIKVVNYLLNIFYS